MSPSCAWSDENGPCMPEPSLDEKRMLLQLVGHSSWLLDHDETEFRLIREAFRHGWEAAQLSHDEWAEARG